MRRALATAAGLAALVVPVGTTPASGAGCVPQVAWHTTRYKRVATAVRVPVGRRLGRGAIIACSTTNGGLYPGTPVRQSVYAVPGLRPQVALALRSAHPALFVSKTPATAAERRVLARLRGR
jgi:hypothetical protein